MNDGILIIDKPAAMTSFGVVARVRRVLSQAAAHKIKVGHTGTLDPFATGLMILTIGKSCKLAQKYSKLDKVYEATICLGKTSSTGDPEGELTKVSETVPSEASIKNVFKKFIGEIWQTPPVYSAIKIDGKRAYDRARSGEAVDMPRRKVTIYSIELIEYKYPYVKICTHVGSGTYIRTLAEDIGEQLGVGAYCSQLRRTKVGDWTLDDAKTLESFGIKS